jgi:hypothetical protein
MSIPKRSKRFFVWFLLLVLSLTLVGCGLGERVAEKAIESLDENGVIATTQAELEQIEVGATAVADAANATPDSGAGTTLDNPIALADGQPVSGLLTPNNIQYYYRITLPPSTVLTVTAENPADATGDYSISVFSTGGFAGGTAPLNIPVGQSKQMQFITNDEGGGAFILTVTGGMFGDSAYNFSYEIGTQDDGDIGGDALSDPQVVSGSSIAGSGIYTGILGDQDQGDSFQFSAPAYSTVFITVRNSPESETSLYAQPSVDGQPFQRSSISLDMRQTIGPSNSYTFADSNTKESRYVIYIGDPGNVVRAQYELEIVVANQDDAGSGGDAGDTIAEATALTPGSYNALLAPADEDCFRFPSTAGSQVTVEVSDTPDEYFGNVLSFRLLNANNEIQSQAGLDVGQSQTLTADGTGDDMFLCTKSGGRSAVYAFTISP